MKTNLQEIIEVEAVPKAPDLQAGSVPAQPIRFEDGCLIDPDTGEIIGWDLPEVHDHRTDGSAILESISPLVRAEQVKARALFVMERMARIGSKIAGLEAEKAALLAPILKHYDGLIKEETRRLEWLSKSERPWLLEFAKEAVAGGKKKSVTTPWGTLGFRASAGQTVVPDEAETAKWLAKNASGQGVRVQFDLSSLPNDHPIKSGLLEACQLGLDWIKASVVKSALPGSLPPEAGVSIKLAEDDGFYVKAGGVGS